MATSPMRYPTELARCGFRSLPPAHPLPPRTQVQAAARNAGLALPADYAAFCATHGTGAFDRVVMLALPVGCAIGTELRVEILFGIGGADPDRDALELLAGTYEDRLPEGMLPVATDPGGDLLLLGCEGRTGVLYPFDESRS